MPAWNELLETFAEQVDDEARFEWLNSCLAGVLDEVGSLRGGRNVIMYGSSFLQRPRLPAESIMITPEDLNGFMACIHGMEPSNGLTLVLHTPGGSPNAAGDDCLVPAFKVHHDGSNCSGVGHVRWHDDQPWRRSGGDGPSESVGPY